MLLLEHYKLCCYTTKSCYYTTIRDLLIQYPKSHYYAFKCYYYSHKLFQLYQQVLLIYELNLPAADQRDVQPPQWDWWESSARCLLHDLFFAINKAADVLSNAVHLVGVLSAPSAVCLRRWQMSAGRPSADRPPGAAILSAAPAAYTITRGCVAPGGLQHPVHSAAWDTQTPFH